MLGSAGVVCTWPDPPDDESTAYVVPVTGSPEVAAEVSTEVAGVVVPGAAVAGVGAVGGSVVDVVVAGVGAAGVTTGDGADAGPSPTAFVAVTWKV